MTDISSVTSSAAAIVAKQAASLNKAASAATTSFANTLSRVQSTIGIRPKTGFTAGPTYEAGTLTGQTKAAFTNTINVHRKSALGSKIRGLESLCAQTIRPDRKVHVRHGGRIMRFAADCSTTSQNRCQTCSLI